jgi:hypothetical protein
MPLVRSCSLCGQTIPKMSKLAKVLYGKTREEILAQIPLFPAGREIALRQTPEGEYWIETCLNCWIHTGEGARH